MSAEKSLALVIRVIEFSETSYIATLFTEQFGKLTGLAKGARRPKSAFENALDLLAVSRVVFLRKSATGMDLLTEARLERRFRAASRDLRRLYAGYYVTELLQVLTDDHDPHPDLFRIALKTVHGLDAHDAIGPCVLRFELAALRLLGHLPCLDACVECGRELPPTGRVAFGQLVGGTLCERCKIGQRHVVSLSGRAVHLMWRLSREETTSELPCETLDESSIRSSARPQVVPTCAEDEYETRAACGELRGLMNNVMSHRMGRRPRMFPYLSMLRD